MASNEFLEEVAHLQIVTDKIREIIESDEEEAGILKDRIRQKRGEMWDDFKHIDLDQEGLAELTQETMSEYLDVDRFNTFDKRSNSMRRFLNSPYFARLDFQELGYDDTESIYIGYLSLIDDCNVLICDWRADVSSMYYDSPLGITSYETQYGKIDVDLKLRRQFKIEKSVLKYMFDSDIAIDDTILQEELGKSSDMKMKTIITTIQKEQNQIIRDITGDLIIVQGVAGSGKTSIALHRLAYLLFKYRKTISSGNIVIYSPNTVFGSYIEDVLPELGEDKVNQTDFRYEFTKLIDEANEADEPAQDKKKSEKNESENLAGLYEESYDSVSEDEEAETEEKPKVLEGDMFSGTDEYYEHIFSDNDRFRFSRIKGSAEFANDLERLYISKSNDLRFDEDIMFLDEVLCTGEQLQELYLNVYKSYSVNTRKEKILSFLLDKAETELKRRKMAEFDKKLRAYNAEHFLESTKSETDAEKNKYWKNAIAQLSDTIRNQVNTDVYKIYLEACKNVSEEMYESVRKDYSEKTLKFEDLLCIMWLKLVSGKVFPKMKIKHVVVDEAQDYPPVVYMILNRLYPQAKFTILGDCDQSLINDGGNLDEVASYFPQKSGKFFRLTKSYRSTVEINEFLARFRKNTEVNTFNRHGKEPEIIRSENIGHDIDSLISSLRKEGFRSNAVICRDEKHAFEIYDAVKDLIPNAELVTGETVMHLGRTSIMPVYLSKGLEFDSVIVPDPERFACEGEENPLMFVACSRALHRVYILERDN